MGAPAGIIWSSPLLTAGSPRAGSSRPRAVRFWASPGWKHHSSVGNPCQHLTVLTVKNKNKSTPFFHVFKWNFPLLLTCRWPPPRGLLSNPPPSDEMRRAGGGSGHRPHIYGMFSIKKLNKTKNAPGIEQRSPRDIIKKKKKGEILVCKPDNPLSSTPNSRFRKRFIVSGIFLPYLLFLCPFIVLKGKKLSLPMPVWRHFHRQHKKFRRWSAYDDSFPFLALVDWRMAQLSFTRVPGRQRGLESRSAFRLDETFPPLFFFLYFFLLEFGAIK